ncbi:MAG: chemotaxis protein CheW [Pseudomonadota bacterium]|nr:chemotaxis protein CheW [Pseudomonadota bacterium]
MRSSRDHARPQDSTPASAEVVDGMFQRPPPARNNRVDVLAIRVLGEALALRADRIGGVMALGDASRLVRLPAADPSLLGLLSVRGIVMPIFSLAALLGLQGARLQEARLQDVAVHALHEPRWIAWIDGPKPAGYAFDCVDGRAWLAPEHLLAAEGENPLFDGAAVMADAVRPLVRLRSAPAVCRILPFPMPWRSEASVA